MNLSRPCALLPLFICLVPLAAQDPHPFAADDWPWWRGPNRNGIAAADQNPPLKWSDTENVLWKTPVPGRGHGSATVFGDQIFLAAAEEDREVQSVRCYDRRTGAERWKAEIHQGNFPKGSNNKSSHASSTVACDGERLFINFLNNGAVYTTALTLDGKRLWQSKIAEYTLHQGFSSSPAIYGPLVIVSADNKGGTGVLAALTRDSGDVVWKQDRPKFPNYTSPIILKAAGRDQLFFTGCELVTSLDPLTGKKNWETAGSTTECVTSVVTDGERIFTSGGYPKNHISAVTADGGKLVWENTSRVYVPSMLVRDGRLFTILDAGVAMCWESATGREIWKGRLGGTFSASPVLVGDYLFAINEAGRTFVLKADPEKFELVGENQLADEAFATPTFCGGKIYLRVAQRVDGKRQEFLVCVGKK